MTVRPRSSKIAGAMQSVDTLTAAQMPTLTGAVTTPGGSLATTLAAAAVGSSHMAGWTTNSQSGTTYTLVSADAFKIVYLGNAAPVTLTIDTNANQAMPVGTTIIVVGIGVGVVTVTAAGGVTIDSPANGSLTLARYQAALLVKLTANIWTVVRDATPPDGSTLSIASGVLSVPAGGILNAQIGNGAAITPNKLSFNPNMVLNAVAGSYTIPPGNLANTALTLNREYCYPVVFYSVPSNYTRLGVFVNAGGGAGSVLRFGIRSDAGGTVPYPGALITDHGTVASTSSAAWAEVTGLSQAITAGVLYWISVTPQVGTVPTVQTSNSTCVPVCITTAPGSAATFSGYYQDAVSGALGSFGARTNNAGTMPKPGIFF
jgi:hypothetical protein